MSSSKLNATGSLLILAAIVAWGALALSGVALVNKKMDYDDAVRVHHPLFPGYREDALDPWEPAINAHARLNQALLLTGGILFLSGVTALVWAKVSKRQLPRDADSTT